MAARPAAACTIDGRASMTLNSGLAWPTRSAPNARDLAWWAPFSLGDASPASAQVLAEDPSKLRTSLPAAAFQTPFRWSLGDGGTATGLSVTHQYARQGWYKVRVAYYEPSARRWVQFDSAQLHVAPGIMVQAGAGPDSGLLTGNRRPLVVGLSGAAGLVCVAGLFVAARGMLPREDDEVAP
ncbi:MAG TPA: PKD domain-containing protein [Chloroflexota bacterium]|nr:PKD domain-containing protein [Chloroflexota bacterium]